MRVIAVEQLITLVSQIAGETQFEINQIGTVVDKLRVAATRDVTRIFHAAAFVHIAAILEVLRVESAIDIFAMHQIVATGILGGDLPHGRHGQRQTQRIELILERATECAVGKQFCMRLIELFARHGFVENLIAGFTSAHTTKQAIGSFAIETEHRVRDVETEVQPVAVVAAFREHAAGAEFHAFAREAVYAFLGSKEEIAEVGIFIVDERAAHVTVLIARTVNGVVGIFALSIEDAKARYAMLERIELFCE